MNTISDGTRIYPANFRSTEVIGSPVKNMTAVTMTTGRVTPRDALIIMS
jgi:hypothetical protein